MNHPKHWIPSLILFLIAFCGTRAHAFRDLETGIFLTRDPAGFVDGPNVYTYVTQNPWTAFDPDGLRTKMGVPDNEEEAEEDEEELEETRDEISRIEEKIDSIKFNPGSGRSAASANSKKRSDISSLYNRIDGLSAKASCLESKLSAYKEWAGWGGQIVGPLNKQRADLQFIGGNENDFIYCALYNLPYREGLVNPAIKDFSADAFAIATFFNPANYTRTLFGNAVKTPLVIGENMTGRVIPHAEKKGFEFFKPTPGQTDAETLIENFKFIEKAKSEGRQIIDIGPDWSRRAIEGSKGRSGYEMERWQLDGYSNYIKEFSRPQKN